jgi:hypothetical protein
MLGGISRRNSSNSDLDFREELEQQRTSVRNQLAEWKLP